MKINTTKLPRYKVGDRCYVVHPIDKEIMIEAKVLGAEKKLDDTIWFYSVQGYYLNNETEVFLVAENEIINIYG